jgi:glycine oxidase
MPRPLDVIVIGAGVVGCAAAYELSRRGASVTLIDEREVGGGATQASAGMLAPYIESHEGDSLFGLTVRGLAAYDEFVDRLRGESGVAVAYRRIGTLDAAFDEAGLGELAARASALSRQGVDVELVDAAAARRREPYLSADVVGALVIPAHGFVSASALTLAAAGAARRYGARIDERRRAGSIVSGNGRVRVATDRGPLDGDAVVLAAGTWSGSIPIDGLPRPVPVRPVRGQLLQLAWNGAPLRHVVWSPRCYLVPWDDGTLLVGATVEQAGFEERTTVAGVRDLLEAACEIVPHAWTAGFSCARVGLRPGTEDDLPIIGRSTVLPRLVYATGHYRNGVLLAPITAQLVADIVLEDRVDPALAPFSPARFGI